MVSGNSRCHGTEAPIVCTFTRSDVERIERAYGRIERDLTLPTEVDPTKVVAEFKAGVLQVHLPKSPAARPQTIEVNLAAAVDVPVLNVADTGA